MDDLSIVSHQSYVENIDYMAPDHIPDYHLYVCWRRNNSITVKSYQDDICLSIPSTISRRLENTCWRRWTKQQLGLTEISPWQINWNKNQDITWLYGPKYTCEDPFERSRLTKQNLSKMECNGTSTLDVDEVSLMTLASLMSFDDLLSMDSDDVERDDEEEDDIAHAQLKPVLRKHQKHDSAGKKSVKFNYLVSSREFVNGLLIDYDFLDTRCF